MRISNPQPVNLPAIDIPPSWEWARLDEISNGVFDCPHTTPKLVFESPYLVVRTQDILTGIFRHENAGRVSKDTYTERIQRAEPAYGDLLYSREGTYFGIAAEIPPHIKVCLGQRMMLIKPKQELVNSRFLRYWLNSPLMSTYVYGFRDGSVAERLNLPTVRGLPVALPPIEIQRAIAGILGALDDKIEVNRRMNVTLESMARAVFRQWFVENEEVANWEVGTVIDDFNLTMGQSPPGETYNENSEGIPFFQGRADFGTRFPSNRVYCTAPTRYANPGDTLVCVRAPVGDLNMASEKCAIGRGVAAIRHKTGSRSYTYYTMQSLEENFKQFEGEGTVFGSINKTDFQNLKIAIPPIATVERFEEICFPLDQMIENNEKESRTLGSLRDSLLPKLMRGEVRVSAL